MEVDMYLTLHEVAERLHISQSTLYRLVRSGQLPAIKLAAQWRVSEEALAEYVASLMEAKS
jgi:excisionase family DNA binding protein